MDSVTATGPVEIAGERHATLQATEDVVSRQLLVDHSDYAGADLGLAECDRVISRLGSNPSPSPEFLRTFNVEALQRNPEFNPARRSLSDVEREALRAIIEEGAHRIAELQLGYGLEMQLAIKRYIIECNPPALEGRVRSSLGDLPSAEGVISIAVIAGPGPRQRRKVVLTRQNSPELAKAIGQLGEEQVLLRRRVSHFFSRK